MDCVLLRDICTPCATSCMAEVRMAMVAYELALADRYDGAARTPSAVMFISAPQLGETATPCTRRLWTCPAVCVEGEGAPLGVTCTAHGRWGPSCGGRTSLHFPVPGLVRLLRAVAAQVRRALGHRVHRQSQQVGAGGLVDQPAPRVRPQGSSALCLLLQRLCGPHNRLLPRALGHLLLQEAVHVQAGVGRAR